MRRALAAPLLLVAVGCSPPAWTPPVPLPFDATTLYATHQGDGRFFNP